MSTSKLQREVSNQLSVHFGGYTIRENIRPAWMYGYHGERLELDFFIEELDIAIEVQGQQHYVYTPHFHATFEVFKKQQDRDGAKRERCHELGITLIEITSSSEIREAMQTVKSEEREQQNATASSLNGGNPNYEPYWEKKMAASLFLMEGRLRKGCVRKKKRAIRYYNRIMQLVDTHGIGIFQAIHPKTAQELFAAMREIKRIEKIPMPKAKKKTRPAAKAQRKATRTMHKRKSRARKRARELLHIAPTNNPSVYYVWGGEGCYQIHVLPDEVVCTCDHITIGATTYCSHIAKYDLVLNRGEGELEPYTIRLY